MTQKTIDILALESILSFIVKNNEVIEITRKVDEMGVLLILRVSRLDMGVVIGRDGEMATSIKKYIKKVGQVNNMNIRLRIDEPIDNPIESENLIPATQESTTYDSEELKESRKKEKVNINNNDLEEFSLN